jgi:DNA-binding transcriptional LysR family regulator
VKVRVDGQLAFNMIDLILKGCPRRFFGLAHLPLDQVDTFIHRGRLIRVLEDWSKPFLVCRLYYPSRRQPTLAFPLLVDTLRYRG